MRIDNDPCIDDQCYNRLECFVDLMFQPLFREKLEVQFNKQKFSLSTSISYIGPLKLYESAPQVVHWIVTCLIHYAVSALSAYCDCE